MKCHAFDGPTRRGSRAIRIALLTLLLGATAPAVLHAALSPPTASAGTDAREPEAARLLSPVDVQNGLRIRIQGMGVRRQSRSALKAEEPRDYRVDLPPPEADISLPPDAFGGEISDERLEGMP